MLLKAVKDIVERKMSGESFLIYSIKGNSMDAVCRTTIFMCFKDIGWTLLKESIQKSTKSGKLCKYQIQFPNIA